MSKELTKMNLIAIVQQLSEDDIHTVEKYIEMIEQENQQLKEKIKGKKSSIKALKIALKERTEERDNHYDKEYLYKSVIDKINEILKGYFPNYASCVKVLDEIEEIISKANIKEKQVVNNNTIVSVGARNFKCECGANVFTQYEDNTFKCHCCGNEYKGE